MSKSPPWAPRDRGEQKPLAQVGDPVQVDGPDGWRWHRDHLAADPGPGRSLPLAQVPCSRTWFEGQAC